MKIVVWVVALWHNANCPKNPKINQASKNKLEVKIIDLNLALLFLVL